MRFKSKLARIVKLPPDGSFLTVEGCPHRFIVSKSQLEELRKVRWRFNPKTNRARGFFGRNQTRQYLHKYVLTLKNRYYPEVTFANGDWWDCRLKNLIPYRRDEDGANRRRFKNAKNPKGVSFCKNRKKNKWAAMIRIRTKLHHLGYFPDPEQAADAYAEAWNNAHPESQPMPVRGRHNSK